MGGHALTSVFSSFILIGLTAVPATGQQNLSSLLTRACGPDSAKFSVSLNKAETPLPPVPSKLSRLVVLPESISPLTGCRYTITRVGVDGKWIGATCVGGYLVAELSSGAHHLCANYQREAIPHFTALRSVTLVPGRTYYYRVEIIENSFGGNKALHLEPIDEDEGLMLMLTAHQAQSKERR